MTTKEMIVKEIETLPQNLLEEVYDFVGYLKIKKLEKHIRDITLASEYSLAKDWLKPEEDEAWQNL